MNHALNVPAGRLPGGEPAPAQVPADAGNTPAPVRPLTRRDLLVGVGGLFAVASAGKLLWNNFEHFRRADVLVARAETYEADLADIVRRGLEELGIDLRVTGAGARRR